MTDIGRTSLVKTSLEFLVERIDQDSELQILTGNASVARELKTLLLQKRGQNQAEFTRIATLESWLEVQAAAIARNKFQPASQQQLLQIWEQIIESDSEKFPDLQAGTLAPQAHRAWLRLVRWQVDDSKLSELEQYNDLQLCNWCQKFESRLAELGFYQRDLILKQFDSVSEKRPLLFVSGGDQIAPLHLELLQKSFTGIEQSLWRDDQNNADCSQANFASPELEIDSAAAWAVEKINKDANARVGILCTENNATQKTTIRRLEAQLRTASPRICLPQNAIDSGIFSSALQLLQLNRHELSRTDCRALIQSPFWGDYPADLEQRTIWEAELCGLERKYLRTADLISTARTAATKLNVERTQSLSQKLSSCRELPKQLPRALVKEPTDSDSDSNQPLVYWAELFSRQLEALGWPGNRELNAEQQQLVELFRDLIQQLVSLGAIQPATNYSTALRLLSRLAQTTQVPAQAPAKGINILNTVESALGFTHLWLIDSSADQWPGLVKPDPLIPIQLQLEYDMPRCHPEQERAFCINLFEQLRGNAQQVVFSISQKDADQETEFSPLLPEYPELDLSFMPSASGLEPSASGTEPSKADWQWVDCKQGPQLAVSDKGSDNIVRGGSSIFNLMAASPFLAFAQIRLNARPLPEAYLGIGPHHRGNILHACLDQIWGKLESSQTLATTSDSDLKIQIDKVVNQQLLEWQSQNFNLDLAYFDQLRLSFVSVLEQWLAYERGRPEFTVEAREQELIAQIGPLKLRLRADRIDRLADGTQLIIDYKSGASASEADLLSSPPAAAQLPLYAISLEQELAGACFALVVSGGAKLVGISAQEDAKPLRWVEDWQDLLTQWQSDLSQLAEDYAAGDSRVFETKNYFGRRDELASLHRMAEYQDLMEWNLNRMDGNFQDRAKSEP